MLHYTYIYIRAYIYDRSLFEHVCVIRTLLRWAHELSQLRVPSDLCSVSLLSSDCWSRSLMCLPLILYVSLSLSVRRSRCELINLIDERECVCVCSHTWAPLLSPWAAAPLIYLSSIKFVSYLLCRSGTYSVGRLSFISFYALPCRTSLALCCSLLLYLWYWAYLSSYLFLCKMMQVE